MFVCRRKINDEKIIPEIQMFEAVAFKALIFSCLERFLSAKFFTVNAMAAEIKKLSTTNKNHLRYKNER